MTEVLLKMVLNTLNQTHTTGSLSTLGIEPSFKKDNHLSGWGGEWLLSNTK